MRHADTLDGFRRDWRLLTGQKPCPTIEIDGLPLAPIPLLLQSSSLCEPSVERLLHAIRLSFAGACVHPVLWHESDPVTLGPNTYSYAMDNVPNRWRAFLIEVLVSI